MTILLGLTGGIASGKSTVSNYFKKLNIPVVDADQVAREVMRVGQPVVQDIGEEFGKEYLLESGEIDRPRLGKTIFTYPEKRHRLNEIVQGEIRKQLKIRTQELLAKEPPLIVMDIPLLYEGKYDEKFDAVMVVYVDEMTQKERLMRRNPHLTEKDALNRIKSQMPIAEKAERADILIDNNGSIEQTIAQVKDWLHKTLPDLPLE